MENKVIVFQGDSITDCGRGRDNDEFPGSGYAAMTMQHLSDESPNCYTFFNRGISGNRVIDVYSRIKRDIINLKPDYLSILVGVNDVYHELVLQNGVSAEKYEMIYGLMIEELLHELPEIKIMLLEPFVLPSNETQRDDDPSFWAYFRKEVDLRRQAVKRLAEKYNLIFIPLQDLFTTAQESAPGKDYWSIDGIHPTPVGHELIKQAWLEGFRKVHD